MCYITFRTECVIIISTQYRRRKVQSYCDAVQTKTQCLKTFFESANPYAFVVCYSKRCWGRIQRDVKRFSNWKIRRMYYNIYNVISVWYDVCDLSTLHGPNRTYWFSILLDTTQTGTGPTAISNSVFSKLDRHKFSITSNRDCRYSAHRKNGPNRIIMNSRWNG